MKENKEIAKRGGTMTDGNLVSRILGHGKKAAKGLRNKALFLAAAGAIAVGGYAARAQAKEYEVNNSMDVAYINDVIADANSGDTDPNNLLLRDTINFTTGTYYVPFGENYNLKPNRNYFFDKVIIDGTIPENYWMFQIIEGGNIDISGNLTIQNINDGFWIGNVPYDNIKIRGVNFNVAEYGSILENRKHSSPLTQAPVVFRDCIANGGERFVEVTGGSTDPNSPYPSVVNSTLKNITSDEGSIDIPKYWDPNTSTHILLGNDEILNLVIINCHSISKPSDWKHFHSPSNIAQTPNVNEPLITGEEYGGVPFTGENCFVTEDMKFVPGTNIPRRFPISPLVIDPNATEPTDRYIGREEPLKIEDFDLNGRVDLRDFAIFADKIYNGSNLDELVYLSEDWLKEDPNYPK